MQFYLLRQTHATGTSQVNFCNCCSITGYSPFLVELSGLCSKLDCLVSFAIASECAPIPYTKPIIIEREEGEMVLEDARHPALETLDNMCFIANDAQFKKDDRAFCIITGPNLGGKSTYLRTVALSKYTLFQDSTIEQVFM